MLEYPYASHVGKAHVPSGFFGRSFPSTIRTLHMIGLPPSPSAIE